MITRKEIEKDMQRMRSEKTAFRMNRKVGKYRVKIEGNSISIDGGWSANHGIIYEHNIEAYKKFNGPEWLSPQLIGMEMDINDSVTKVIYNHILRRKGTK